MPLHPFSAGKPAQTVSARIQSGSLVAYEHHSKPQIGITLRENKNKWLVINSQGGEVELAVNRLQLLPSSPKTDLNGNEQRVSYLKDILQQAEQKAKEISLEDVWEIVQEQQKDYSIRELTEVALQKDSLLNHLAMRSSLLVDKIFFKRKKWLFEPRPENVIEELKVQARVEAEKEKARRVLIDSLISYHQDRSVALPSNITALSEIAVFGKSAQHAKEMAPVIEELTSRLKISPAKRLEDNAFRLLVEIGYFSPDENLLLIKYGRNTDFSKKAKEEAELAARMAKDIDLHGRVDLSGKTTITIDSSTTKDLDDAITLDRTKEGFRVGIHISDVAAIIPPESELFAEALARSTSIYTADQQIAMLPTLISEGVSSLLPNERRLTMSFYVDFDHNLDIIDREIVRSVCTVSDRLTYDDVDKILVDSDESVSSPEVAEMLFHLWQIASALETRRLGEGAMQFSRREMSAKLLEDGRVELEDNSLDTPSHKIIEEFMVLANETAALIAEQQQVPFIYRSQEKPEVMISEQGDEIPEGPAREYFQRSFLKRSTLSTVSGEHFGLGLSVYTQVTSPIRRIVDLVNQQQLSAHLLSNQALYSAPDLDQIIAQAETGISEALNIQRERNRYWLLRHLEQQKVSELDAVIIRADASKPLAEIDILFSLQSFEPLPSRPKASSRLGEKIRLKIERLSARGETLKLTEIPSS